MVEYLMMLLFQICFRVFKMFWKLIGIL